MPELPEVERGRRIAEGVGLGRVITRARCARDTIVYDGVSPARMRRVLIGRRVVGVHRRGKQLWFELDHSPHPLFHFGMTGAFHTPQTEPLKLASSGAREARGRRPWPPRFSKIHLHLDDGGELVMTNKRRLGRIRLRQDPLGEPPLCDLGFDPLLDLPSPASFSRLLSRRAAPIKAVLLDQSFAAGVGNWIADEVLYQAKIDPHRRGNTLDASEMRRVRTRLAAIVRRAVEVDAQKHRFPRTWLFHRRWGRDRDAVTSRGEKIDYVTIGGRTTAWVPAVQR